MIYEIIREETLSRRIVVQAESEDKALEIAEKYFAIPGNEIDYEDYLGTEDIVSAQWPDEKYDRFECDEIIREEDV